MSVEDQSVKALLEVASKMAVMHSATMKAFHAQLKLLDKKTQTICSRFLLEKTLEPVERELLAEELYSIQRSRTRVVKEIKQEAAKHGLLNLNQ